MYYFIIHSLYHHQTTIKWFLRNLSRSKKNPWGIKRVQYKPIRLLYQLQARLKISHLFDLSKSKGSRNKKKFFS